MLPAARQSALDKAKAEAKAKRLRDEKEAASALEDFVKEFDADISDDIPPPGLGPNVGRTGAGRGSRRHFTGAPKVRACLTCVDRTGRGIYGRDRQKEESGLVFGRDKEVP